MPPSQSVCACSPLFLDRVQTASLFLPKAPKSNIAGTASTISAFGPFCDSHATEIAKIGSHLQLTTIDPTRQRRRALKHVGYRSRYSNTENISGVITGILQRQGWFNSASGFEGLSQSYDGRHELTGTINIFCARLDTKMTEIQAGVNFKAEQDALKLYIGHQDSHLYL